MSSLLEFARGPMFLATFLFMVLALTRLVVLQVRQVRKALRRTPARDVPWGKVVASSAGWMVPVRHVFREVPVLSLASVIFHVGLIVTPIFLADHVLLWQRSTGVSWPSLGTGAADALTLTTLAAAGVLLLIRLVRPAARMLSRLGDYVLLLLVALPFLTGYLAAHPTASPLPYRAMMLTHVLSANLLFVLIPTTKLAHVVLFPFARLSGDVFWRLVPGAGAKVARALRGTEKGAEA